jgi:ribosome-interacting GTPase 1
MKKINKFKNKKPKDKVIKELAQHFEEDIKRSLPISIQPNGNIVYKGYYIKKNTFENWALYNLNTHDLIEQFYLKTSALMAAKAYNNIQLEKYFEIKRLDNQYWANYSDTLIYRNNIKKAKDFSRYLVLLNKLEHTEFLAEHYKEEISKMFKWSFV